MTAQSNDHDKVARVRQRLEEAGLTGRVQILEETTRTARDAAAAVNCELGQIVKSLVFQGKKSARSVLVITSGANKVDAKAVRRFLGEPVRMAAADVVRRVTGFDVGGVAPVGHPAPLPALIDEDLMNYQTIWAAAGTDSSLFHLSPTELVAITRGQVTKVRKD